MNWTADIATDPTSDFELYVELLNEDTYKARLQRDPAGELEVVFYGGRSVCDSMGWLSGIATRFQEETRSK